MLRIALLCFFPDLGHILPLLKIARAAKTAGHEVRCYFPDRAKHLARRYGVPLFSLALESEPAALNGSKSIFFMNYSGYGHSSLFIDPPVLKTTVDRLDAIMADAKAFAPDIVVGDRHVLGPVYELIARVSGARYVRNGPSGTLAHLYRPFVTFYGEPAGPRTMWAVETAGALFQRLYRPIFYARHFGRWRASKAIKRALAAKVASYSPASATDEPLDLSAGLTWVEMRLLNDTPSWTPEPTQVDLPPLRSAPEPLSEDLEAWLSRSPEPVVYVSFGSILGLKEPAIRAIGKSLKHFPPCRVIWATPLGDTPALRDLAQDPRFFVTRYVPQAELLKRQEVAVFVTHGGAGSVQEALLGGVPMLCVPLHADNGYIAGLVKRLGVGLRVGKGDLGKPVFTEALKDLLIRASYKRRAEEIACMLRSGNAEAQVTAFLEQLEPTQRRNR